MKVKGSGMFSWTQNTQLAVVLLPSWLRYDSFIWSQETNCPSIEAFSVLRVINSSRTYRIQNISSWKNNSKIKNIRHFYRVFSDFSKGYPPRTNIVKDKKSDLLGDSSSIVTRWRNYFSQLLNVHAVNDVKHTDIHTAEPLMPEPTAFEVE